LVLLPDVEVEVLTHRLRFRCVGLLNLGDLRRERRVELLGEVDVLRETLHRLPQMHFLLLERGVVLAELVLTVVQRAHDRVQM
jgi:hypothetical protein